MRKMNPKKTYVCCAAYPDGRMHPAIFQWLERLGIPASRVCMTVIKDEKTAFNAGVARMLGRPVDYDEFIFIEHDIIPVDETMPFTGEVEGDVIVCPYPTGGPKSWVPINAFHHGLWRTSREVLDKVLQKCPPWFDLDYTQYGTANIDDCICDSFRKKIESLGYKIGRAGWAEHDMKVPVQDFRSRARWIVEDYCGKT